MRLVSSLNFAGTDVGAGGSHAAEDFLHRVGYRAAKLDQGLLAFGSAVFRDAARVLLHRDARAHSIEALVADAVALDDFACAFVMACQHPAEHHEVGAAAERLRDVARRRAAAVGADAAIESVRGIRAFDDRGKLRIAHAGHVARRADGTRADADFHDVGAAQDQLLGHFAGDHVSGHDGERGMRSTQLLDVSNERFRISVRDIDADIAHGVADLRATRVRISPRRSQ